jgi:hypothetical protein
MTRWPDSTKPDPITDEQVDVLRGMVGGDFDGEGLSLSIPRGEAPLCR